MKFDAIVGNPPYQEETVEQVSETNGQAPRKSVFQFFQTASDDISSRYTSLIYPGARWIHRSGKGMAQFGFNQINDVKLARLDFYPDATDVFNNVAIADGISIVLKDKNKNTNGFEYIYHKDGNRTSIFMDNPGESLITLNPKDAIIVKKVLDCINEKSFKIMHDRVLPRNLFGIESNFAEMNPGKIKEYIQESRIDYSTEIKLLTNDKAGKAGRAKWFVINKSAIKSNTDMID